MPLAGHPLHRSVRAELPHTAPTSDGNADMQRRTGSEKGQVKGQVWSREWEIYWIFEDSTWNQGLGVPTNSWNDKQATEVQLPSADPLGG